MGAKTDLFDRRLRANLALFTVKYQDLQETASDGQIGLPQIGTLVPDEGNGRAKGFECDMTVLSVRGLTFTGSAVYMDFHFTKLILANLGVPSTGDFLPDLRPQWTANLQNSSCSGTIGETVLPTASWRPVCRSNAGFTLRM